MIASDGAIRKIFDYWLGAVEGGNPQYVTLENKGSRKHQGLFDEYGLYPDGTPEREDSEVQGCKL